MKKRLLSLVLCLVMVFSLFPSFAAAADVQNVTTDTTGDYVYTPVNDGQTTWRAGDTYPSGDLYAKVDDDFVKVTPTNGTVYYLAKTNGSSGDVKTSWTAALAHDWLDSNSGLGNLYYHNGSAWEKVTPEQVQWYKNAGTIDVDNFVGDNWSTSDWVFKTNNTTLSNNYYFNSNGDINTTKPFWHRVYENTEGVIFDGFWIYLWYYTGGETAKKNGDTIPSGSHTWGSDAWTSDFDTAWANSEVALIPTCYPGGRKVSGDKYFPWETFHARKTYGGEKSNYIGGDLYTRENKNSVYNQLSTSSTVLAWPLAQTSSSSSVNPGSSTYSNTTFPGSNGYLYYRANGVQKLLLENGSTLGEIAEKEGDTIYTGQLFTKEKLGTLGGHKDIAGDPANGYTLTIDSWATGKYQKFVDGETPVDPPAQEKTPLDIVLVVDQSGSMRTLDLEGGEIQYNSTNKTEWTVADLKDGTQYYYKDGDNYYPVQLGRGTVYRYYGDVRGDWTFGWGNDGISVMVNGAPTYYNVRTFYYVYVDADGDGSPEMHRLRAITAGLDLHYGFYPYIYRDENNEYAQMGKWKDNHYWFRLISPWGPNKLRNNDRWNTIIENDLISFLDTEENLLGSSDEACKQAKMNYSWVTSTAKMKDLYVANGRDYADLYYVDANGERHNISTRYFSTDKFNTKTPLYTISGGSSRVSALESAVSQFVEAVKAQNEDDQIAIVGYAQNSEETTVPSGVKYVGRQSGSYVNTGVFSGTDFKGFTNYDANPSYALQSVADVNFSADTFGTWGGTYTNYGMAMANQISGRANAQKVVIFFTDGEPGELGYEHTVAAETLINGAAVKADADVYTVGLYPQSASDEVKTFLKQLSSEYNTTVTSVPVSDMDPGQTYFVKQGDSYTAISTDYYGESSLGWWEHNADGTYTLMNVKGANAGAGEEYLYTGRDGQGETTGENADTSRTYYSSRNNEVKYEYHWFDAQMNDIVPNGSVYTLSNTRQEGAYSMTASTKAGLEQIFTDLAATIRPTDEADQQPVAPSANGTATNYDKDNSYVQDVISSDFELGSNYTVTVREVTGVTAYDNEQKAQGTEGPVLVSGNGPSATSTDGNYSYQITGNTIKVTGWDFGAGYAANKALRVTITGLTPTVTGTAFSNDSAKSGIYDGDDNKLFSYNNPSINIPTYTVQWSVKGSIVETDSDLPYNSIPSYDGEDPVKEADDDYTYTFVGWSANANATTGVPADELPAVPANADSSNTITYYAIFRAAEKVYYDVYWMNGTKEMEHDEDVLAGTYPSYDGATPSSGAAHSYFIGWTDNKNFSVTSSTTEAELEANLYYGQKTVDQLTPSGSREVTLYAVYLEKTINTKTVVVEYSLKHEIDEGVYSYDVESENGGTFDLIFGDNNTTGKLYFTPGTGIKDGVADLTPMKNVSTAIYYTGAPATDSSTTITHVTVVSGSSLYFDDSLAQYDDNNNFTSATMVDGKYDYETALAGKDVNSTDDLAKGETRTFKFSGSRIDVYCTTDGTGNSVYATLKDEQGNKATDKNGKAVSAVLVSNTFKSGTMYSTPTVTFDNLDISKTYVLTLKAMTKDVTYRLDGVRVYNTTDNSLNGESGVQYTQVRDLLTAFDTTVSDGNYNASGAVFVDKDGFKPETPSDFATYKTYGPKNEVYLAPGEAIAFQVHDYSTVKIGMKSQSGNGIAYVTNEEGKTEVTLNSVVERYVDVKPTSTGIVVVKNVSTTQNELIAVTNVRVMPGTNAPATAPVEPTPDEPGTVTDPTFSMNTNSVKSYLRSFNTLAVVEPEVVDSSEPTPTPSADPEPSPSADPEPSPSSDPAPSAEPTVTPTPSVRTILKQVISSFVSSLFNSISRLFGR